MNPTKIEEMKRQLVLARLRTLRPKSKILIGGTEELSIKDLISHVENNDELGKKIISAQMKMLKVLASNA